jgi:purine nucleoside phosphorylase
MHPARIAIPEQIIDYSYAREHTYFAAETEAVDHIDFSYPYDENLRQQLILSAQSLEINNFGGNATHRCHCNNLLCACLF